MNLAVLSPQRGPPEKACREPREEGARGRWRNREKKQKKGRQDSNLKEEKAQRWCRGRCPGREGLASCPEPLEAAARVRKGGSRAHGGGFETVPALCSRAVHQAPG